MNLGRLLSSLVPLTILLAGCIDGPSTERADGPIVPSHGKAGGNNVSVEVLPTGHSGRGGEPTVAVLQDGTIFTNAWDETLRSKDRGRSWETVLDISFDIAGVSTGGVTNSGDPWLWADPITDRIFTMHALAPCTSFWWSDDGGDSWTENRVGCITTYNDHPQLTSGRPGPDPNPLAGLEYPTVLYQCFNEPVAGLLALEGLSVGEETVACLMSYDGGQTWPVERVLATQIVGQDFNGWCRYLHSPAAVSHEGIVAVATPAPSCVGIDVHISRDSGLTWQTVSGPRSPTSALAPNPSEPHLAWSDEGALYALWQGPDYLRYLARADTLEGGWSDEWSVTAPGVKTTEFHVLQAGTAGRVAVAYLGTREIREDPHAVPPETEWHLFLATTEDGDSASPTFVHHQATPDNDPVQIGCTGGEGAATCTNLGHFIGSAVTPEGTFLVSFTDGCDPTCVDNFDSRDTHTVVAALQGWSLRS